MPYRFYTFTITIVDILLYFNRIQIYNFMFKQIHKPMYKTIYIYIKTNALLGRKIGQNGKRRNWWTPYTLDNFKQVSKCHVEQYNKLYIHEVSKYVSTLLNN